LIIKVPAVDWKSSLKKLSNTMGQTASLIWQNTKKWQAGMIISIFQRKLQAML